MRRVLAVVLLFAAFIVAPAAPASAAGGPIQVYGAWHCGNDACIWGTVRTVSEFDSRNHWLIDRGDGRPSVNVVVLSFLQPAKLLHLTDDATTSAGVPKGITPDIVNYFTSRGVRVMLSIGGITYTSAWDSALAENPAQLARNAVAVAQRLGVGIEIDYEQNSSPKLAGLQTFIDTYRAALPYDATGANPAARLTIDVAAGARWLIDIDRKATADWLRTDVPVLDYANAMVPSKQPSASAVTTSWQEHIDGKPQFAPPIPPLAPAKFTGSLYIAEGSKVRPECTDFANSVQRSTGAFVQSTGMLGFMFWAAELPSTRGVSTAPPNSCEGGVGAGATAHQIPIPLPALRQG
ncbi:hypothetical protein [Dactylosporangium sp. NPDC051484]|uniref:hypothetical protein n=1 Tax=Dactylosporangium sp. NPDC051484 TaxID=3154942 RepID=UPI00344B968F